MNIKKNFCDDKCLTGCVVLHPVDVGRAGSLHDPPGAAARPAGSNLIDCGIAIQTFEVCKNKAKYTYILKKRKYHPF